MELRPVENDSSGMCVLLEAAMLVFICKEFWLVEAVADTLKHVEGVVGGQRPFECFI